MIERVSTVFRQGAPALAAAVILGGCESPPPAWCGGDGPVAAIMVGAPAGWTGPAALEKLWEAGDLAQGQGFASPSAVALHPESGVLAVADPVPRTVTLLGSDGEWMLERLLQESVEGEPPVFAALEWRSDDLLAGVDLVGSRILVLDEDLRIVREEPIAPEVLSSFVQGAFFLRGRELVGTSEGAFSGGEPFPESEVHLLRATPGGETVDTLVRSRVPVTLFSREPVPGLALPVAAPLPGGRLAVAGDVPEYRIDVLDRTGEPTRRICRVTDPLPPTDREVFWSEIPELAGTARAELGRLFTSADSSTIWAQRTRGFWQSAPDRTFGPAGAVFDVLRIDGTYLGEVAAPADVRFVAARGDTVIGLRHVSRRETRLVAYHLGDAGR